jgi:hypothetical protein
LPKSCVESVSSSLMRLAERMVSINNKVPTDQSKVNSRKIVDMLHRCTQKDVSIKKSCEELRHRPLLNGCWMHPFGEL